jgi:hypothetical protein
MGADVYLTIPAIGWVARDHLYDSQATGVPLSGGRPVAGSDGPIAGYDPAANRAMTSVRSVARKGAAFADPPDLRDDVVYQDEWVNHLVRRFGQAVSGGIRYYAIDNEPDLWAETHTDVHPARLGYDDLLRIFLGYATAIKDVDPTAFVAGPALSGWQALSTSPLDRVDGRLVAPRAVRRLLPEPLKYLLDDDRRQHGGGAFLPWWLDQVRRHDERGGRRTLDVLDVHFYPQAPGVYSDRSDRVTNALRLRSTRALWDETYIDESWIGQPIALIPRLRTWIARHYLGTRLGIGEWSWGADQTINGALAIVDVLGIFGRERVDVAAYWTVPKLGSPGSLAFALYQNFDGVGGSFGDFSLPAVSAKPHDVTVYASRHSQSGDVTVLLVNKRDDQSVAVDLQFTGELRPALDRAHVFRLSGEEPTAIQALGEISRTSATATLETPAQSATITRWPRHS